MAKETMTLPIQHRAAEIVVSSYREEDDSVELVWTTGASVRRYDWREGAYYNEVLEVGASSVRLGRLNAGAPLLDTHDAYELSRVIGAVVEGSARMEGGKGICRARLSKDPAHAGIVANIKGGIIRNISVGYAIHEVVKTERAEGEVSEWRVTDWEPYEVSAVPIPADAGSQFRNAGEQEPGHKARTFPVVFRSAETGDERSEPTPELPPAGDAATTKETAMTDRKTTTGENGAENNIDERGVQSAPCLTEAQARATAAEAVKAERKRAGDIRELAKRSGEIDLGETFINDGKDVEEFRAALLDKLVEKQVQTDTTVSGTRASVGGAANKEKRAAALQTALLHRYDANAYKLDADARDFRGMTLVDMARDCLEAEGISTRGMSRDEIARAALAGSMRAGGMHSTSDFPIVLANTANKTLRAAYEAAPQTFRPLVRVVSLPDFKTADRIQLGEAPAFEKVNEAGEFKRGTIGEGKETIKLATYGKVVGITRQTIVNDDLGAFTRIPAMFGTQYANLESDIVWARILLNPTMLTDNTALFHSNHGNIGTAGAIAAAAVGEGFKLMRMQKGLDGKTLLNVTPSFIVAPVTQEMTLMQFLTQTTPNQQSQVTPQYLRALTPITDPRLDSGFVDPITGATVSGSTTNWYMAGSPSQIDMIELAYLEGNQGVYTETRTGFDVDGVEIKVRADVGAAVVDWRGFVKNPQ